MLLIYNYRAYHGGSSKVSGLCALGDVVDLDDQVFHMNQLGKHEYLLIVVKENAIFAATLLTRISERYYRQDRVDLAAEYGVDTLRQYGGGSEVLSTPLLGLRRTEMP